MRSQFKMIIGLLLLGLLTFSFNIGSTLALAVQSKSVFSPPHGPLSPFPTTIKETDTPYVTATPTLISGVLSCNTVAPGVTCTNYGTYLDYNINIVVTGINGTANDISIGTYIQTTNPGYVGMSSNFTHCETSAFTGNTISSAVAIEPWGGTPTTYPYFFSGAGVNVCTTNHVVNDWRYVQAFSGNWNWLSVKGNVDWPITGYSVVGHIYLYSNQNFMTVTPTRTPTKTLTPTVTKTPTVTRTPTITPTSIAQCHGSTCNGYYASSKGCDIDAQSYLARNLYNTVGTKIGEVHFRYSDTCLAQWAQIISVTNNSFYAEDSIRWGNMDYTSDMWPATGQIFYVNGTLYTLMYGVDGPVLPPALVCGSASVSTPVSYPPLTPPINLNSPYGLNNCMAR